MSTHEDQSGEPVHEKKTGFLISLRNNFFTGIIIALPIAVTVWLLTWFIRLVDDRVLSVVPPEFNPNIWIKEATGFSIPGIGLVIAVVALWMLGVLASNFIGTSVIRFGERLLGRVPLVSNIYNALKQIVTTMAQQKDRAFKDVCLIEYPRPGLWAIGFVTSDLKGAPLEYLEEDVTETVERIKLMLKSDGAAWYEKYASPLELSRGLNSPIATDKAHPLLNNPDRPLIAIAAACVGEPERVYELIDAYLVSEREADIRFAGKRPLRSPDFERDFKKLVVRAKELGYPV